MGFCGLELLWGSKISIDFASKKMLVSSSPMEGTSSSHPGEILVTITAEVQGSPVRLLVDTGMPRILFYDDRLRKRLPHFETDNLKAVAIGQVMFANEGMVRRIKLGPAEIQHPKVLFFLSAPAGFPENIDGVLGTACPCMPAGYCSILVTAILHGDNSGSHNAVKNHFARRVQLKWFRT